RVEAREGIEWKILPKLRCARDMKLAYLLFTQVLRKRVERAYREDQVMRLAGFGAAVETYSSIQPIEKGIAFFRGISSFIAVSAPTSNDVPVAPEDVIDLFRRIVMVRNIGAARSKIHDEQAHHLDCSRQHVAPVPGLPHQELEKRRRPVSFYRHEFCIVGIRDHQLSRGWHNGSWWNPEAHDHHLDRSIGRIRHAVFDSDGQIHEIVRLDGYFLSVVQQNPVSFEDV